VWVNLLLLPAQAVRLGLALPLRTVSFLQDLVALVNSAAAAVARLAEVADRVNALLDDVEPVVPRFVRVVDQVEPVIDRLSLATDRALVAVAGVDTLVRDLEGLRPTVTALLQDLVARAVSQLDPAVVGDAAAVLTQARTALSGLMSMDPRLVDEAAEVMHALPELLERIDQQVLPAVAALEGLMPGVARLTGRVDNLSGQVVEVGSLLTGLPGAARLLRRGTAGQGRTIDG